MSEDRRRQKNRFRTADTDPLPDMGDNGSPGDEDSDDYPTTDLPPLHPETMYQRMTPGDLRIIIRAMRGAVRAELRLFLEDKWSSFGKYSAKGAWALLLAGLVWLALVVTHGWKTPVP